MENWRIKTQILEFDDKTHSYFYNGEQIESVTQLLAKKFPSKYSKIPKDVLEKASERGTRIHKEIECYCKGFDVGTNEVKDFKFLKKHYGFKVIDNEIPIFFEFGGKIIAGRIDMILEMDGEYAVADLKTTSTLDKEYLGHQLNLYRLGAENCYDYKISSLYGIHIKDGKRKMIKIPIVDNEALLESLKEAL